VNCYQKAAQLLAARPHFRAELAAKLVRRGFPADEIAAALDRLAAQGLLDDRRTAADFIAHRRERSHEGVLRLRAELVRRGAPADAVDAALSGLDDEDDLAAALAAAARWGAGKAGSPRREDTRENTAALARHLARKGFSRHAIVAALKARPGGSTDSEDEGIEGTEGFEPE
jgi:regulatory protein